MWQRNGTSIPTNSLLYLAYPPPYNRLAPDVRPGTWNGASTTDCKAPRAGIKSARLKCVYSSVLCTHPLSGDSPISYLLDICSWCARWVLLDGLMEIGPFAERYHILIKNQRGNESTTLHVRIPRNCIGWWLERRLEDFFQNGVPIIRAHI